MRAASPAQPIGAAEFAALLQPLAAHRRLLVAVSGGPDSTALMHALARWAPGAGCSVLAATIDHELRPGSRAEAEAVAADASALGLEHRILTWSGPKPGARLQERAREARYGLLTGLARQEAAAVATAHTLDDQAETVLLRLAAGSGIAGLAGIPAHTWVEGVSVVRPFLAVAKARLVATCRAEGWRFVEDPSNSDPRFARGRLRRAGPILAAEGLTAQRLARLAERARRADEVVQAAAAEALARSTLTAAPGELRLDGRSLLQGPEAVAIAALSRAVAAVTRPEAPRLKLERLESACLDRLRPAFASGLGCRLTLAGLLLDLAPDGSLRLTPAPGRRPRKGLSEGSDAAGAPHSLGNAGGGA